MSRHVRSNFERHDHAYKEILKLIPNFRMMLNKLSREISIEEGYEGSVLKRLVGLVSYPQIFESTPYLHLSRWLPDLIDHVHLIHTK